MNKRSGRKAYQPTAATTRTVRPIHPLRLMFSPPQKFLSVLGFVRFDVGECLGVSFRRLIVSPAAAGARGGLGGGGPRPHPPEPPAGGADTSPAPRGATVTGCPE